MYITTIAIMAHVKKKRKTTHDGNCDRHDAPALKALPSSEAPESDVQTCSDDSNLKQPARKLTFLDLPQEIRDMIWKEVLLAEDDLGTYNKPQFIGETLTSIRTFPRTPLHMLRDSLPPIETSVLLSTRPSVLSNVCRDARAAALKHHKRDPLRNGLPAFPGRLDSMPWLSRSSLQVVNAFLCNGPGSDCDHSFRNGEIKCDPFKDQRVLFCLSLDSWDGQDSCLVQLYEILRNARDDQVVVVIPWISCFAWFSLQQLARYRFLFNQALDCFPKQENRESSAEFGQTIFVEAGDSDMLHFVIQAADKYLDISIADQRWNGTTHPLPDKTVVAEMAKKTLVFIQDLWVAESRKASREGDDMPKVRLVIEVEIFCTGKAVVDG